MFDFKYKKSEYIVYEIIILLFLQKSKINMLNPLANRIILVPLHIYIFLFVSVYLLENLKIEQNRIKEEKSHAINGSIF